MQAGAVSALGVGVDEAWDRATIDDLRAYRATWVARYVSEDTSGKNLTRAEADAYRAAGIAIVTNYEYAPGGFRGGYSEGQRVARLADQIHRACGGPADRPIYCSVDVDVDMTSPTERTVLGSHFRGIANVIDLGRTGAYGECDVIRYLFDHGLIQWGWQTYAWSHGQWDPRAQIRQVANGIHIGGHAVDRDENQAPDFGQWGVDMTSLDDTFSSAVDPKVTRSLVTDIREAASILLDGKTIGGDKPAGLYAIVRGVVAEELAKRPPVSVDAAGVAGAMLADPRFVGVVRAAMEGLSLKVSPSASP